MTSMLSHCFRDVQAMAFLRGCWDNAALELDRERAYMQFCEGHPGILMALLSLQYPSALRGAYTCNITQQAASFYNVTDRRLWRGIPDEGPLSRSINLPRVED